MQKSDSKNFTIVLFASGTGSNVAKMINYAQTHHSFTVKRVFSNKKNAAVLQKAKQNDIPTTSFSRDEFYDSDQIKNQLLAIAPDLIVLAGFMWIFPKFILEEFPQQVINIHPALLPNYGGKGMYGDHVHRAVLANEETKTGITIHYVNEQYDEGQIIAQQETAIAPGETLESLKKKIQQLEHHYYPRIIDQLLKQNHG